MESKENTENNGTFTYTYSAKQQEEVKRIREQYAPREENKMEQLRALDRSVTTRGQIASLTVGIISSLLFGTGMACILEWSELSVLGVSAVVVGVVVGVVGMAGMLLAYPIYAKTTKKRREKLAPQIIKLSDELMQ